MSEQHTFPSVPAMGADKQDRFARLLANKLSLTVSGLEEEIKAATGRDTLAAFPHYYSKDEGGRIIDRLLAKCKLAGVEIATRKSGARGRARQQQEQHRQENGGGGKQLKDYSAVELYNELESRGVRQLAGVGSKLMLTELKGRGIYVGSLAASLQGATLEHLAAELERRGYPGEAMKANPDLLGQAEHLGRLLLRVIDLAMVKIEAGQQWAAEARFCLVNAGLLAE